MTNYAQIQKLASYLNTDFGRDLACKKFNLSVEDLKALVGVYVRGKKKGQLKCSISWFKVVVGGWVKTGAYDFDGMQGSGFVAKPGLCFGFIIENSWSGEIILAHKETILDRDQFVNIEASYRECIFEVRQINGQ
jgi:hypothetical protein